MEMRLETVITLAFMALPSALHAQGSLAGTKPVTDGYVVRGLSVGGAVGASGTPTNHTCDFANEPVDMNGKLTGASVNCGSGKTKQEVIVGLPQRFDAYCAMPYPPRSGRLIAASVPGERQPLRPVRHHAGRRPGTIRWCRLEVKPVTEHRRDRIS